jgi:O-antigen/teichoic acid export membrane protein
MNAIHGFLQVIATSMSAGIGNNMELENKEENYSLFSAITFLYMMLSGWSTVCLLCLFQPFMMLWMGENMLMSMPTVIILCLYFYLLCMGDIRGVFAGAAGLFWETRYKSIIESIANIILNYTLVRYLGLLGIILATVITIIFINFGYGSVILFKYYFKSRKHLFSYFLTNFVYCFVTGLCCIITFFACELMFNGNTISHFIGRLGFCLLIPPPFYFIVYRKNFNSPKVKSIISKIYGK